MIISKSDRKLQGTVSLPGSKSESNRALIIQALCKEPFRINHIAVSEDTHTLQSLLSTPAQGLKDCGHAGSTFRFLAALYAAQPGAHVILTGSERMKKRPVAPLVEALQSLGADILYTGERGYPPLEIKGATLHSAEAVSIRADISSQFISALLLIAPTLRDGLRLQLESEPVSVPYIDLSLSMMAQFGVSHERNGNEIYIAPQAYQARELSIEADWSSASYWYALVALAEEAEIFLPGLNGYSLQGDSILSELMANFGVTSQFINGGVRLLRSDKQLSRKIFDFKDCPDLAQTVIVCCAALRHEATFTGLQTLRIKETDRILALQQELRKTGAILEEKGLIYKLRFEEMPAGPIRIETYEDHRMALSFAALAMVLPQVEITDPGVIVKSYPGFWNDLESTGFSLSR